MSYQLTWRASPNFTPGPQTQAFYGRPRSLSGGAGHWWNWPRSGASHDGIVEYMANAARQAAPHAVLSDARVTEMVRDGDTAWCTGAANPYTFAIEIDPRIMFKWGYDNPSPAEQQLGERIFNTLCEYIADKGYHNLPWKPHNVWAPGTQCNPIPYDQVMARAKEIWNAKYNKPKVVEVKRDSYGKPKRFTFTKPARLYDMFSAVPATNQVYAQGSPVDIIEKVYLSNGNIWYRTQYSSENNIARGFRTDELAEVVEVPEWQRNIVDIADLKLMVMPAEGTSIINLNNGSVIGPIAKGTWVDFAKETTVGGKRYLLSNYSVTHAMPNGILADHVGVPAEPPKQEKPAWLENWEDIQNVTMYTRVKAPLVNLLNGETIKEIEINTAIEVGSTTLWGERKYALTEYSTGRKEPRGILIDHLDIDPIKEPTKPAEPAPEQPPITPPKTIEGRVGDLEAQMGVVFNKLGITNKEVTPMAQAFNSNDKIDTPAEIKQVDPTAPTPPAVKGIRTAYQAVAGTVVAFLYGLWELPGVPEYVSNFVQNQGLGLLLTLAALVGIPAGIIAWLQNRAGK